jgi:hypothetical protein
MPLPTVLTRPLDAVRVDFNPSRRQPGPGKVLLATAVSLVGSLVADAIIVAIGKAVFPSTKNYVHFQFGDYATLTIIGVLIAALGWPVITRISSQPRWIYSRLAVIVTAVLLLPDIWILHQGQPGKAVAVLMVMHLAIAVVTYLSVVGIATPGSRRHSARRG